MTERSNINKNVTKISNFIIHVMALPDAPSSTWTNPRLLCYSVHNKASCLLWSRVPHIKDVDQNSTCTFKDQRYYRVWSPYTSLFSGACRLKSDTGVLSFEMPFCQVMWHKPTFLQLEELRSVFCNTSIQCHLSSGQLEREERGCGANKGEILQIWKAYISCFRVVLLTFFCWFRA